MHYNGGHGGRARVEKVTGAAKETAAAPSYAAVTRTPPSPPQARPMKRARRPSETNNVSHTIQEVAPVKAVDASPKIVSGTQKAADTVKEIAISGYSAAVAAPVAAVSSKQSKTKHTMQLRGRSKSLSITSPSSNPTNQAPATNKPIPPPTPTPLSPILQLDGQYHTPTYPTHRPISSTISTPTTPTTPTIPTTNTSPKTTPTSSTPPTTSPTTPFSPKIPTSPPYFDFDYTEEDRIMFSMQNCNGPSCEDCRYFIFCKKWPTIYENVYLCTSWKCSQKHFHKHKWGVCWTHGIFKEVRKYYKKDYNEPP